MDVKTAAPVLEAERFTAQMLVRSLVKGVALFLLLNIVYGQMQPAVNNHLPTVYNTLVEGRTRFIKDFDSNLDRLLNDHIIAQASPETFNIVMLGSSEIWGSRTTAEDAVPALMDRMGLVAADGRPVRVYNLGFPFPNAFKDLLVLVKVLEHNRPVDLVVISTFDVSLTDAFAPHEISLENGAFAVEVATTYGLPQFFIGDLPEYAVKGQSPWFPLSNNQTQLRAWSQMQIRSLIWQTTQNDIYWEIHFPFPLNELEPPREMYVSFLQNQVLFALARISREASLPIIILSPPVPVVSSNSTPWMREQIPAAGLPLVDCWQAYRDPAHFEDYYHIMPAMHDPYARLLAWHLGDSQLAAGGAGLPLRLPPDFVAPAESCEVFPSTTSSP